MPSISGSPGSPQASLERMKEEESEYSQQLLVSNLPLSCVEEELVELFTKYGKVKDVAMTKKLGFVESVRLPPNSCFIQFEQEESVGRAVNDMPILLYGFHRLHVTEQTICKPTEVFSTRQLESLIRKNPSLASKMYPGKLKVECLIISLSVFGFFRNRAVTVELSQAGNFSIQMLECRTEMVPLEGEKDPRMIDFENIIFMHNGLVIEKHDDRSVQDLNIKTDDHIITLQREKMGKQFDSFSGLNLTLLMLDQEKCMKFAYIKLKAKLDVKSLKQKMENHMKTEMESYAIVHNGIILADVDTLEGAGVRENDRIVMVNVKSDEQDKVYKVYRHSERLMILNAKCSSEVITNSEPACGEPSGLRIIHNLDPDNLTGHSSRQAADVCTSLINRIQLQLFRDIMSHFEPYEQFSSFYNGTLSSQIMRTDYAHASDLLSDLHEALFRYEATFDESEFDKELWKEAMKKVIDFYNGSEQVFKNNCGKFYEPFQKESFFSSESFPFFSIFDPLDNRSIETVIYAGPARDGKQRHDFYTIKLRAFTSRTTIQDVMNSFKVYANMDNHNIDGMTMSFNNKPANPTDLVCDVLGGLFEKNYITVSDLTFTEKEDLDDILEFIEGKMNAKDDKASKRKKKNKVKKRAELVKDGIEKMHEDESVPKEVKKVKISSNSNSTLVVSSFSNSKETDQPSTVKSNKSKKRGEIKKETKFEGKVAKKPNEKICNDENSLPVQQNIDPEPSKDSNQPNTSIELKIKKNPREIKEKTTSKEAENTVATENRKGNSTDRCLLEAMMKDEMDMLNKNKSCLENMIELKSKEMKDLIVQISTIEDQNLAKDKRITSIDVEIEDLETRVAKLGVEKQLTEKEKTSSKFTVQKLMGKKVKLERYIETEMNKTKDREIEIKQKIEDVKKRINALDILDTKKDVFESKKQEQNIEKESNQKLLDFLTNSIREKEKDLECPVCLETATIPIYSCVESHLICSACRPKVAECPECRVVYRDKEVFRRHRYAEKTASELERLKEEREKMS